MNADANDAQRQVELVRSLLDAGHLQEVVTKSDRLLTTATGLRREDRAYLLLLKAFALDDRRAARECVLAAREQLGVPEDDEGHWLLADAILRQATFARDDGDSEEAVRLLDGLLDRYQDDPPEGGLETIVNARMLRASACHDIGKRDAALAEYDAIVSAYGGEADVGIKMTVADALSAKASVFRRESKYVSAMDALAALVNRFEDESDPDLRRRVVTALCELGYAAETLQRPKQAAQIYKIAVEHYADDEDEETARLVAWAREARDELT